MTSPLQRQAAKLAAEKRLPADNWLARRVANIDGHRQSLKAVADAMQNMGRLLLDGAVSTNLRVEQQLDPKNTRVTDDLGYISCSIIPSIRGHRPYIPTGLGYSWTPDVAMQVNAVFRDRYARGAGRDSLPTGEVELHMSAKTWGRLTREEMDEIAAVGNSNTWAEYGDRGHSRNGSSVLAIRQPGELITSNDAEIMLAPLAAHVIDYFELVGRPNFEEHQIPGDFSSHLATEVTLIRDERLRTVHSELPW